MTTTPISAAAQAARETHRDPSGRFGTQPATESDAVDLSGPAPAGGSWGEVRLEVGSRTPWGKAQHVNHADEGIAVVSCAGHGGVKVSRERNAEIDPRFRAGSGWYEEDLDHQIVAWTFPGSFADSRRDAAQVEDDARAALRSSYPDRWTEMTGETVDPADSWVLRERAKRADMAAYRVAHADEHVTTGGWHPTWAPEGWSAVETERATTGEKRTLLVENGWWARQGTDRTDTPVVVDPDRYVDITDVSRQFFAEVATVQRPAVDDLGIDYDKVTPAQGRRAMQELNTRYRYPDGQVRTLAEGLVHDGASGKHYHYQDGAVRYSVALQGSRVQPVSYSTWKALDGLEDVTEEGTAAYVEYAKATDRVRRNHAALELERARKAQEDLDAARQHLRDVHAAESKVVQERNDRFRTMVTERIGEGL